MSLECPQCLILNHRVIDNLASRELSNKCDVRDEKVRSSLVLNQMSEHLRVFFSENGIIG